MTVVYEFPEKAYYGKAMPKNKIYAYANPRTRIIELFYSAELFIRDVDKESYSASTGSQRKHGRIHSQGRAYKHQTA